MSYEFDIVKVPLLTLAVCETFLKQADIPTRIIKMFDIVYAWLHDSSVKQVGHNYAIYDQFGPDGMRMRAGFPISEPFDNGSLVHCLELAATTAAHTKHIGSYSGLHSAYSELNNWCISESLHRDAFSWEEYGDWNDDPSNLETDIYIKLI